MNEGTPVTAAPPVGTCVLHVAAEAELARAQSGSLSAEEQERASRFVRPVDRDRYLVAHVGLRRELGRRLDIAPAAVRLTRLACPRCGEPHGRPALAGAVGGELHFSLSHAGDLVLLAFAGTPVGADVEQHPRPSTVEEVAGSLHPREQAELTALAPAARPAAFARCWTRKEAYLKGLGTGLAVPLDETYVGTGLPPGEPAGWQLADLDVDAGYAAALAHRTNLPAAPVG